MIDSQANFFFADTAQSNPAVMISSCLLGEAVRYDGKDQRLALLDTLATQLQLIGCCPEVGAGLAVPRPPVQLVQHGTQLMARGRDDHQLNVTEALQQFSQVNLGHHPARLCGYIFKSRSPSCGLNSTPLFNQRGEETAVGSGIQASYYQQQRPWLIFAEETELDCQQHCQAFVYRCRVMLEAFLCPKSQRSQLLAHYGLKERYKTEREFLMLFKEGGR